MTLLDWFPAITTTALAGAALWLVRNLFITRLTKTVQHEFDVKIAGVKAEIESKKSEIEALRSGALAAASSKNAAIYSKRAEAVNLMWEGVIQLQPGKALAETMSVFEYKNLPEFAHSLADPVEKLLISTEKVAKTRPYLPPLSWALYTAYETTISHYHTKLLSIRLGEGEGLIDLEDVKTLLISALPDRENAIEDTDSKKYYIFLGEIEERLLSELQDVIAGVEANKNNVLEAQSILSTADEIQARQKRNGTP